MTISGWYYLHTNGDLIYKHELGSTAADIRDSDLAVGLWPFDPRDRACAWRTLIESLAAGARPARVAELATKWGCDDEDAAAYARHVGIVLKRDGNAWCAHRADVVNLQESPAGFGATALLALAELAKELGYRPSKMFGATFHDLVARAERHIDGRAPGT